MAVSQPLVLLSHCTSKVKITLGLENQRSFIGSQIRSILNKNLSQKNSFIDCIGLKIYVKTVVAISLIKLKF